MQLNIGHLYGTWMNTYGDDGNIICLKKRAEWRGIKVKVVNIPLKYKIKNGEFDLYFFGGGQDQAQELVSKDLLEFHSQDGFKQDIESGIPLLAICGGYQLLGYYYQPQNAPKIPGLELLPIYTKASDTRMIGNLVVEVENSWLQTSSASNERRENFFLVGFENHSGKTYLKDGAKSLAKVIKGFGNNGEDRTEGCIYKNAIGCYLHGSLLPKNPKLADWLIKKALEVKYKEEIKLDPLNDFIENSAHNFAVSKFS